MADLYRDFVFTRVTAQVTASDTVIQVEDVSRFPSNALLAKSDLYITFESSLTYPPTFETVKVVSISGLNMTVLRGQAGTTAQSHGIVTYLKGSITSDMMRRARSAVAASTTIPPPDLDVYVVGDQFFHTGENRPYSFTGRAGLLADTFTRAASATTMGSTELQAATASVSPWIPFNGTWGINANGQAYYVGGGANNTALVATNAGGYDFDLSWDIFASTTAASDYGIVFRLDITGQYGYYLQMVNGNFSLYRINAGTFQSIAAISSFTTGTTHTWRVTTSGNLINIFRDGSNVYSYTEAQANFLVANQATGNYYPGANVGIRLGTAAALTDTSLVFDNFKSTYVGNTALNVPTPQGWVSSDSAAQSGIVSLENSVTSIVQQLDDAIQADANIESTVLKHDIDLTAIFSTVDDLLPVLVEHDGHIADLANTDTVIATQVDELLDVFLGSSTTSGIGAPTGSASLNALYVDTYSKRLYQYGTGGWVPITYSGPGVSSASIVERGVRSAYSNTVALPTGSQVGDFAVWAQTQRNGGPTNISPPSGFTVQAQGYGPNNYWSSWSVSTKILTTADITAGSITGPSFEDCCVLRVFNFAGYDVSVASAGNNGYTMAALGAGSTITAPSVTTTSPNDVVISMFFGVGYSSPSFSSVSGSLSNTTFINGSQVTIFSGDEIYAAPGATTARTATVNGGGMEVAACTLALKVAAPPPVPAPLATPTAVKTAAYTAGPGELVLCSAAAGAFAVTLPSVSIAGTTVLVKKTDASANIVTVAAAGAATIDGTPTFVLRNQYDALSVLADGTNWWVV